MSIEIERIKPEPTADETAAIVTFLDEAWPRRPLDEWKSRSTPAWRFSGRWWARPVAARRDRPWF